MIRTLQNLPDKPGVYQYLDENGKLLYVGKAKSLKLRLKSYWRFTPDLRPASGQSPRILKMLHEAKRLEYLVVESEEDALILENSLIKQLKPKYNILLRDDKTYPYIVFDESARFGRFELTRKVEHNPKLRYYGPFPSGGRALLDAIYEVFPLVQKKSCLNGKRVCLFYQIGRCLGPCEGKVSPEAYAELIAQAKQAIEKRTPLIEGLQKKMQRYAQELRFEEAAKLRDRIEAIEKLKIESQLDLAKHIDADIFAITHNEERGVVVKLFLRNGKIVSSAHTFFRHTHLFETNEAYKQALLEFYRVDTPLLTKEILVAHDFEDTAQVESTLSKRFGTSLKIKHPRRGVKAKLISLALQNGRELLRQNPSESILEQEIRTLCSLDTVPYRVEAFDNSHMMGAATVGAMVVYDEGKWDKESYRRYQLQTKDEYAQMHEMLSRRIEKFATTPPPDLWVIDGGETLRKLALTLLESAGVYLDVVAIAKEKLDAKAHRAKGAACDILHTPAGELRLKPSDKRLLWFQKLRDEAHRFALAYHRDKKRKEDTRVKLLETKGVGRSTLQKLLNYFGTFEAIEKAGMEELKSVVGEKKARTLYDALQHDT